MKKKLNVFVEKGNFYFQIGSFEKVLSSVHRLTVF